MKIKAVFIFFSVILALCIGFFVYYGIAVSKPYSSVIIGGADGPTVMYVNGLSNNMEIIFTENDFEIIENNKNRYEFRITNNEKINLLKENIYTELLFIVNGIIITAKGHSALSSRMPYVNSDYYFLTDPEGKTISIYGDINIITLYKIDKE